ncbi:TPA: ead/Ea22-like family protein [Salmonella enterica]|nr:ead/Ea22-like family protein [Salmonella enterica subsp. enterica serovar Typhimurium]EEE3935358.1 ead/Ea22-like family protein [Salmonella enterica subsp. enterica serovar Infantis]EHN5199531.1 ead/Ea22-like family protein [Salmonella enterica subsp. enterica serovar Minnesota]HBK1079425.1 ead/Ea22-like family protein [Salmonella enterica]EHW4540927.1 ead/Ea22-like family protein [Salmonella enterica subsp. enterica serovar Minnesota]
MKALNKQALRQKAVKAGSEEWQSRKEPGIGGEYTVIVKGSLVKHQGWSTHRPVADEIVDKKTMDFISAANPATVLALLDELEAAEKRIAEQDARTVTVKLPADYRNDDGSINDDMFNTCAVVGAFRDALADAGIGVKGE